MQAMVILAAIIAVSTIFYGVRALKTNKKGNVKTAIISSVSTFGVAIAGMFVFMLISSPVFAEPVAAAGAAGTAAGISLGEGFKYLAAALSTGLATIGTGKAVGSVGSSAIGAISEDSSILGKTLIFVGMAEGIAIYGMIISILILFV
ncbi:MAG: ATP synthase subunit C [Cellulosilyticaceae bacterium]